MDRDIDNGTIAIRPHIGQFVINELPWLLLCAAGYIYAGMGGLPIGKVILALAFMLTLYLVYQFAYLRRTVFTLDDEQLIYEHGIFHRRKEHMELYRVNDYDDHQTLMQQLCGLKTVTLKSTDPSTPLLKMPGIRKSCDIVKIIRHRVEANKRKKGIYEIANR